MLSNIGKWIKKHNTTTQRNSIHRGNGMKSRKMQTKKLEIFFGISRFCPSEKTKITSSGHNGILYVATCYPKNLCNFSHGKKYLIAKWEA